MGRRLSLRSGILGVFITLICLAILLREVSLRQSLNSLTRLSGPFLLVTFVVFLVNLPLRSWRWQLIFPKSSRPHFVSCLVGLGIGNMSNFLLPGRAGDLARCVLLDGSLNQGTRALATVALEKILDALALIGMVMFSILALHPPRWLVELVRVAVLTVGIGLIALLLVRYRSQALATFLNAVFRRTKLGFLEQKSGTVLCSLSHGLGAVNSATQMVSLLVLTAAIWVSEVILIWSIARGLVLPLSLKSAAVASAVLGLGLMIPGAPGGLGTYELFGTEVFKLAGMAASSALALTLGIHAWVFVANIALGICLLAAKGLSLDQLRKRIDIESDAPTSRSASVTRTSV